MKILTDYSWLNPHWKPIMSKWCPTKLPAKPVEPDTSVSDKISLSTKELKNIVTQHFGQTEQSPSWDPQADLNKDGVVNTKDQVIIREMQRKELVHEHFGETAESPGYDPKADLNKDGVVNTKDQVILRNRLLRARAQEATTELKNIVTQHFGQTEQSPSWDPQADLNKDGVVNTKDQVIIREMQRKELVHEHFGETAESPGYDPKADLNKDGVVNTKDQVILRNRLLAAKGL